jgi:hypothetical protein
MTIFYAYSNNRDETIMTYYKVCENLDNIIDVDNNDLNNSHQLLDKIKNHIKSADIFVCDITPDYILNDNVSLPNPNAMIELGYALQYFENSNIILLLNEKISKNIPSMISGFEITYYNTDVTNYYLDIVEKIKSNINNYYVESNEGWKTFNYQLSQNFITTLQGIIDIIIIDYIIRINYNINQAVILFPCNKSYTRKININSKKLILKNKEICFSNYNNLYNELQHLELIIKLNKDY